MKGTFFQKPLELSLRVEGEAWNQGDAIQGVLEIKNRGSEPVPLAEARVCLARGQLSKVRQKSPEAFKILQAAPVGESAQPVAPGASASFDWRFQIDRNFAITDSLGSAFLLYGLGEATDKLGQLQLAIHPAPMIQEFLERFKVAFRFVEKGRKSSSKGYTELKLAPPDSKAFSALDHVLVHLRFDEEEALAIEYIFHVKKVQATVSSVDFSKGKKELEQVIPKHEYLMPSGRTNHDRLEAAIREALAEVESKVL